MSTLPEGDERTDAGPGRSRPTSLVALALIAALVGGLLTRFATASTDAVPPPAPTAEAPEDEIEALRLRVERDPADVQAWQDLASAHITRASASGDPADYAEAGAALDEAERLRPGDPTTLAVRGNLALVLHDFDDALELGEQARRDLPDSPTVLAILVDAEVELGRYDDAATTLQELLDRRPALPALSRASYLRQLNGDLPGAIEAMDRAVEAGSAIPYDQATVRSLLGDLRRRQGDHERAGADYERALDAAPDLAAARVGRAWVRAAGGDRAGAVADLEEYVERSPAPAALLLLNDLQRAAGDPDGDDSAELVRAIATLQEEAGQVVDLEMALFEADEGTDPARAVALAEQAHAARPDNVFVADALAWALFRAGDPLAAAPYMASALRLGATEPLTRYHAAEIAHANGDDAAAAEHLRLALVDPWSSFRHHDRLLELADELGVPTAPAVP